MIAASQQSAAFLKTQFIGRDRIGLLIGLCTLNNPG
jgi:hypothetical protein